MKIYNNRHIDSSADNQLQKIPLSKKNKEWREANVDYVISATSNRLSSNKEKIKENTNLYLGNIDETKLKYVLDPYQQKDGFPATARNINIIKQKIDLLVGEEVNNSVKPSAYCTSGKSSEEINKKKMNDVANHMMSFMASMMSEEELANFNSMLESGEVRDIKDIVGISGSLTYKSSVEESARTLADYLYSFLDIKDVFISGFFDLAVNASEVYYVGKASGEPTIERVDLSSISYTDSSSSSNTLFKKIEDSDMVCRKMFLSANEIYDRLYDICSESDLDKILELGSKSNAAFSSNRTSVDNAGVNFINLEKYKNGTYGLIPVYHTLWRSFKKIGFLTYQDEEGDIQETIVSEQYVKVGNEIALEWEWMPEIWEGYKVADDIFIGIRPLEYQNVSKENLLSQKMPYFGITLPGESSIVDALTPLQYLHTIIWYRLELALAKDHGRVLNMDITKIPKSLGIEPEKWLHLLTSTGVNFYNPKDTGFDNNEDSIRDASVGISGTDLSMANTISEYVNILNKIEESAEQLTGISRQRSGFTKSNEYVGSIQQSISQSSLITEPLFWAHEVCKKNVMKYLLNMAKDYYKESGKTFLSYISSDNAAVSMKLSEDFFYEDYDVFIDSTRRRSSALETIKSLYQAAMQNGTNLSDIATILSLDSIESIRSELKKIEDERARIEQQSSQQEAEANERKLQAEIEAKNADRDMAMMELELEKYKIDSNNQAKIAVAELQALGFASGNNGESDSSGIESNAEESELKLAKAAESHIKRIRETNKIALDSEDMKLRGIKLNNDMEVSKEKLKIEREKLDIERKKLSSYSKTNKK